MPQQQDIDAPSTLAGVVEGTTAVATPVPAATQHHPRVIPTPAANRRADAAGSPAPTSLRAEDITRVLKLEVPVIVQLAERMMPLADILNLNSGAIIEFEKPCEGPLDLMINNKCIGHGMAVKVNENFGIRLTTIGSIRERINALGK